MARMATNATLEMAKASRSPRESFPISSAGIRPPRPDPEPSRAPEERPNHRQHHRHQNEPRHHPPGHRARAKVSHPRAAGGLGGEGEKNQRTDDGRRNEHSPRAEESKKNKQRKKHRQDNREMFRGVPRPERLALDVDVEVRNHDERENHER